MTPLRPCKTASKPANNPPIRAPREVDEVMSDLSHAVIGCSGVDNDGARCKSAAEIDAVSSIKLVQKRAPDREAH